MAEETQNPSSSPSPSPSPAPAPAPAPHPPPAHQVSVQKPLAQKDPPPAPEPQPEAPQQEVSPVDPEKPAEEEKDKITQSVSFKEETNVVSELPDSQKKALDDLKLLVQDALNKHDFTLPPPPPKEDERPTDTPVAEEKKEEREEEKTTEEPSEKNDVKDETPPPPPPVVESKEEEKAPAPAEPVAPAEVVVVAQAIVQTTTVDEDGAKTLEAIEETVVAVSTLPAAPAEEPKQEETPALPPPPPEEVFIWGIPILGDDRSDVILLKFLRARDFKVKDAFTMIKNTVRWRKEKGIDALLEEDLGNELDKVVFMHGFDKEAHPVCYNVYGEFQNKELYQNTFADEEKRAKFLNWRIQFLEKSIRKLDFSPDGICTIVQVNDLKNSPGPAKRELRQATKQALQLLQDNYPEFVAKQVFINVPWWYLAFNRMISPFLTQRTKSKFVFAGPSRSAEALFKYISPEQVPVQYGGLSREGEQEFTTADPVTEVIIKPATKHSVEIPVSEAGIVSWEVRVVGWDVNYLAEFSPDAESSYTVIVSKTRKMTTSDEPIISDSFKVGEPGKIVLTIDNQSSKKKKLLYRSKIKAC